MITVFNIMWEEEKKKKIIIPIKWWNLFKNHDRRGKEKENKDTYDIMILFK